MSYQETLVCDGCSVIVDAGSRRDTTLTLLNGGGRAFARAYRGDGWEEVARDEAGRMTRRHLCGNCVVRGRATFFDDEPIPASNPTQGEEG